jgi:16S rRNA (cytidine1402-2'-O)-methyltransferase
MTSKVKSGVLYLIPTPLGEGDFGWTMPAAVRQCIGSLSNYIVERPKTARHFLKQAGCKLPLQEIQMQVLDKNTRPDELPALLAPLLSGHDVGLLSEAGCPAVADPGADLVRLAHLNNVRVIPLVGPSAILLALMASGLNGQCFKFHGYLPIEKNARVSKITALEKQSVQYDQTQIFIETPYRNQGLLVLLTQTCRRDTDLCIASDLTLATEYIATRTVKAWQHNLPDINKKPAMFLMHG